jgi:hypothetical protein
MIEASSAALPRAPSIPLHSPPSLINAISRDARAAMRHFRRPERPLSAEMENEMHSIYFIHLHSFGESKAIKTPIGSKRRIVN